MTQTTKMAQAIVEIRSQKSVGSGEGKFGGPDQYIAVQVVPHGVEPLKALNRTLAKKRGITIKYFGEGYSRNQGPRSMYGQALAAAIEYAKSTGLPRRVQDGQP